MNITNIAKSVNLKLATLGIDIVADDIRSGFEKPAFFVQTTLISSDLTTSIVTVNIHYFPKDKTQLEHLKMIDKLNELFGSYVLDEFQIQDIRADVIDNVLQYRFEITEQKEIEIINEEEYELMKHLKIRRGGA